MAEKKELKEKAIDIGRGGKLYVQVKDRINFFNDEYENGSITTKILSDGEKVVMKAKVTPDVEKPERYFTGISASNPSKAIEKQSPYEVAETSAVGRALAMMGIGVIDSVASVDEMNKSGANSSNDVMERFKKQVVDGGEKCPKCEAPMAISQAGKPYCSSKCWLK